MVESSAPRSPRDWANRSRSVRLRECSCESGAVRGIFAPRLPVGIRPQPATRRRTTGPRVRSERPSAGRRRSRLWPSDPCRVSFRSRGVAGEPPGLFASSNPVRSMAGPRRPQMRRGPVRGRSPAHQVVGRSTTGCGTGPEPRLGSVASGLRSDCRREEDEDQETHDGDHRDDLRQDGGEATKRSAVCSHGLLTPIPDRLLREPGRFT